MKPQGCQAQVQSDEYFCHECDLRWSTANAEYVPECLHACKEPGLATYEEAGSVTPEHLEAIGAGEEREGYYPHQEPAKTPDNISIMPHTGKTVTLGSVPYASVGAPAWSREDRASFSVFEGKVLLVHPLHTPMVLHPGAKKFVDVEEIK